MCFTSYTVLTIIFVYIIGLDYVATSHFFFLILIFNNSQTRAHEKCTQDSDE